MATYVAFEGGEGSGKTTQAGRLADRIDAVLTMEPGGTDLGSQLRRLLLGVGEAPIGARAETLLMAADRAQHLTELVVPTLATGRHVVSDRSAYSSLAYQGGGRGLGVDEVRAVNEWAIAGRWPDVVVLLDCEPPVLEQRMGRVRDRLELESDDFHLAVRRTYLDLAAADPGRWLVVAADGPISAVAEKVWEAVGPRLGP